MTLFSIPEVMHNHINSPSLPENVMSINWNRVFLVVLYDKEIQDSQSISGILQRDSGFCDDDLLILWNNGPTSLTDIFLNKDNIILINAINNTCLPQIYNLFTHLRFGHIIIVDHDTTVTNEFVKSTSKVIDGMIGLPTITCDGHVEYPKEFKKPSRIKRTRRGPLRISVSSGLVISKKVCLMFIDEFGSVFDARFCFYGVDTSFFYRLQQLNVDVEIVNLPAIEHDLSKLSEDANDSWRTQQRCQDFALQLKYYYRVHWVVVLLLKNIFNDIRYTFTRKRSKYYNTLTLVKNMFFS